MKYYFDLLLILIILTIHLNCVQNANKMKTLNNELNLKDSCIEFNSQNKKDLFDKVFEESKTLNNSNTTYFLFFSNKKDNFEKLKAIAGPINRLLAGELNLTFFCENTLSPKNVTMDSDENDKKNVLNYYVVKNGNVEKNETLTQFSQEFIAHMLEEFKLTDYLEKKYLATENKGNNMLQTSEFSSFIELTLKLKESKAKSTEKEAIQVKSDSKEKVVSKNRKKSLLKKGQIKNNITLLKESSNSTSSNNNLKKSSSIENKAASEEAFNAQNSPQILNEARKRSENDYNSDSIIPEKHSNHSSPLADSTDFSNSNTETDKKEETASSFLEDQVVLLEEPLGDSRIIPLRNQFVLSFSETKLDFDPKNLLHFEYLDLSDQATNRLSRFFLAMFIVMISTSLCFLLVKLSIDWATKSKSELLYLNDKENKEILDEINQTYNLVRTNK